MGKQKGFTPVLVVILVAAAVTGGYLIYQKQFKTVSQQPQPTPVPTSQDESSASAASPVPNGIGETANWKTYTNNTYNFSFLYPDHWLIGENSDKGKRIRGVPFIFLRPNAMKVSNSDHGEIIIWLYNNISNLNDYTNKLGESPGSGISKSDIEKIIIGDIEAFKVKNIPGPIASEEIIFQKDKQLIVFHFNFQGGNSANFSNKDSKRVFDQILSTFKFTN